MVLVVMKTDEVAVEESSNKVVAGFSEDEVDVKDKALKSDDCDCREECQWTRSV